MLAPIIIACYIVGSFPTGYLAGRILKGIDVRAFGSGNAGATNVFRVLGAFPGVLVLLVDMAKGYVCVSHIAPLAAGYFGSSFDGLTLSIVAGLAAIAGHNWSVFLRFRGGKGVATSAGVLIAISPVPVGLAVLVWLVVVLVSRYVSLGSIIAAISLPVFMAIRGRGPLAIGFGTVIAILVIIRHRGNIVRLLRHEENRIGKRSTNT